jgi:hypothetical protein
LFRHARRAGTTTAVAAFLAVATAAPAIACPPVLPGDDKSQRVYANPLDSIGITAGNALLGTADLTAAPAGTRPSVTRFKAKLTRNPAANFAAAFRTPEDDCERPGCIELRVRVPKVGSRVDQTLYARAAWPSSTQYAHIWGISPSDEVVGRADVADSFDKRVGNADVTPLAEFTVPNPEPGVWRIQVRAVFGVDIPVRGSVALVKAPALELPQPNVVQLANRYLTQTVTYNIVFANRHWSKSEVAAFRAAMPTEYRSGVLVKQYDDACENPDDEPADQALSLSSAGTLMNWGTSYFCGTAAGSSGYKPYFEPLHYRIRYRFLEADRAWTNDLFATMQKHTKKDQPFVVVPPVGSRSQQQGQYLSKYDAEDGKAARGPNHVVTDPTVGDKIDAFAVEDWIFNHRYDRRYAKSFRDVETGSLHSGAFITPDPDAYYDPYYTARGHRDLDRIPQGPSTSYSFFALDTFHGKLATKYFRPNAYHFFDVSKHMVDPDLNVPDGPDLMRAWGGRYRFFMHDLGAGPNTYESMDTALTQNYGGSASAPLGDPPIWDYDTRPEWQGKLARRTARDAQVWLFARFLGGYLYRPVPADVYALADTNWQDCYSNPECAAEGISYTDLKKIYDERYVKRNLGAALPGATFNSLTGTKGFTAYRHLGCAANRAVGQPDPSLVFDFDDPPTGPVMVPDPECVGKKSDKLQELLELAKARGDELAGGVNDFAANPAVIRHYVEAHRSEIAPQPPGQFTLTNISVVWPGATTWALPAVVGGIAMGTPNDEGWGNLNNVNDRVKAVEATDCERSKPFAPGCNGVPPISGGAGFSYTIEHESSHFLGLTHPHDYFVVARNGDGGQARWNYYGTGFTKYADFSMAPTTYAGAFAPYSVLDQDIIQKGHTAEYLRQTWNYLADAHLKDGMAGRTKPSIATKQKLNRAHYWMHYGKRLFRCGDYLHSERAMRNAALSAQGVFGPVVEPRQLKPGEKVLMQVNPQPVYGPDGKRVRKCEPPRHQPSADVVVGGPGGGFPTQGLPLALVAMLAVVAVVAFRRRAVLMARPA